MIDIPPKSRVHVRRGIVPPGKFMVLAGADGNHWYFASEAVAFQTLVEMELHNARLQAGPRHVRCRCHGDSPPPKEIP